MAHKKKKKHNYLRIADPKTLLIINMNPINIDITRLYDYFLLNPSQINVIMKQLYQSICTGSTLLLEQHYVDEFSQTEGKFFIKMIRNKKEFNEWYSRLVCYK